MFSVQYRLYQHSLYDGPCDTILLWKIKIYVHHIHRFIRLASIFSNSNIAVVGKDICSCTTYIIGHAKRTLSRPSTFSDPYLYRTAVLRAFCLLVAALLHGQRQVLGTFGTSPALPRPLHFPLIFARRWQQLRRYSVRKDSNCCFLLYYLVYRIVFPFLLYFLMET